MVNFYSQFVAGSNATIYDVMRHVNHMRKVAGVDHIGIGADYDGVDELPDGLEDVSSYPKLFDLLAEPDDLYKDFIPWSREDLKKLAGLNFLRVMRAVEQKKRDLVNEQPFEDWIPMKDVADLDNNQDCKTDFNYVP